MTNSGKRTKVQFETEEYTIRLIRGRALFFFKRNFRESGTDSMSFTCLVGSSPLGIQQAAKVMDQVVRFLGYKQGGWKKEEIRNVYVRFLNGLDENGNRIKEGHVFTLQEVFKLSQERHRLTCNKAVMQAKWEGSFERFLKNYLHQDLTTDLVKTLATLPTGCNLVDRKLLLNSLKKSYLLLTGDIQQTYSVFRWVSEIPTKLQLKKKSKGVQKKCYSVEELNTIFSHFDSLIEQKGIANLYFRFLYLTGMRPGEVIGLTNGAVDLANHELNIYQQWSRETNSVEPTKTKETRVFPINSELAKLIADIRKVCRPLGRDAFLFHANGNPLKQTDLAYFWISAANGVGYLFATEQISTVLPVYSLRSAFVTHAIARGNDPIKVASLCGHSVTIAQKHYRDYTAILDKPFI